MNWVESALILGGVSLDVFAAMEREGSLVAKIEREGLCLACLMVSAGQALALCIGNLLAAALKYRGWAALAGTAYQKGITVAAFAGLGIHLAAKAMRRDRFRERRSEQFDRKKMALAMAKTGGYTLLAGIVFGLLRTNKAIQLLLAVGLSVVAAIAGVYSGYRFGSGAKQAAYGTGAVLMWGYCLGIWFLG